MSTRHARTADKATNEKNSKILKALLQKPANKYCADCKKKDARWASWNLGVFMCIRCSGIHRSMGVHISKVKSVDLDTWLPEQVENMILWGNERANKYWEANLRENNKANESNIDMWIRAKYEQKKWAMKGPIPDPRTLGGDEETVTKTSPSVPATRPSPTVTEKPKTKQSDFANLDAFLGSPSTSPVVQQQTTNKPASQLQGADFFFDSTPAATINQTQTQNQSQKHNDFKSSILSLYSTIPAAQPVQPQNNNFYNQMAGLSLGNTTYQQPIVNNNTSYQQTNSNNIWGSFASATPVQQPQGSQFFSTNTTPVNKPEKKDVFADLLS